MDEIDVAGQHNEDFQAFALRQQQCSRELEISTLADCIDCDEPIPEERRRAKPGCLRCTTCQTEHELNNRRF